MVADEKTEKKVAWYRRYVPQGVIVPRGKRGLLTYVLRLPTEDGTGFKQRWFALRTVAHGDAGPRARRLYETYFGRKVADQFSALLARFRRDRRISLSDAYLDQVRAGVRAFATHAGIGRALDITPARVQDWLNHLAEKREPVTVRNHRARLHSFCQWLCSPAVAVLDDNPVRTTRGPRCPRKPILYLTKAEVDQCLAVAEQTDPELHLAVGLAYYGGLRLSEVERFEFTHIDDLDAKEPHLLIPVTKTGEAQQVCVCPKLVAILARYRDAGVTIRRNRLRWEWRRMLSPLKAKVPKLARKGYGWHAFRRAMGSVLAQSGTPMEAVMTFLRHSSIAITMRHYAHLRPDDHRKELDNL